jgi:hypothetical protein
VSLSHHVFSLMRAYLFFFSYCFQVLAVILFMNVFLYDFTCFKCYSSISLIVCLYHIVMCVFLVILNKLLLSLCYATLSAEALKCKIFCQFIYRLSIPYFLMIPICMIFYMQTFSLSKYFSRLFICLTSTNAWIHILR